MIFRRSKDLDESQDEKYNYFQGCLLELIHSNLDLGLTLEESITVV